MLSPRQGSSTASSRVTTRLRGHTRTHITMTNPTVSTARDTSAWPAQNGNSQLTNSPKRRREEAGDALQSPQSSEAKHIHYGPQLRLGEGLLLLPDWNPSGSHDMRSRLSKPRVEKEGRWEIPTAMGQSQGDTNIYRGVPQRDQCSKKLARQGRSHCRQALGGKGNIHDTVLWTTASWYLSPVKMCNSQETSTGRSY